MIKAENLSYSFPHKELYNKISFTLEDDVHCAFIGTNGTGKSTLVNMILHPDKYLYDGKLIVDVPGRIGYVSQFYTVEEEKEITVFDYISEEFVRLQNKINQICEDMAATDHLEELMEEYPACKIIVVDSYSATVQEGLLVTEAARMAEDGLTLEEAAKRIETLKMTSRIFFTTADLSYLQKGGRVGKAMIQVASMLKIKPMIQLYEGELQAAGIVRSRKKSLQRFIDDTKRFFKDKNINDYRICTGYGYDKEEFNALYAEVVKEMRQLGFQGEVEQYHIGCTIGVHTGPTPIGIAVIRKYDA